MWYHDEGIWKVGRPLSRRDGARTLSTVLNLVDLGYIGLLSDDGVLFLQARRFIDNGRVSTKFVF
jgi:hypothetical protein